MSEKNVIFEDEEDIDFLEIFFLLRKKAWKILFAVVVSAFLVFGCCHFLITPRYEATSKLYIVPSIDDETVSLNDLQIGEKLALDYKELILTRPLLENVLDNLDLKEETTVSLEHSITIKNVKDTRVLSIVVSHSSPQAAADIANEVASATVLILPEIMGTNYVNIAEKAVVPTSPSTPRTVRNTLAGAAISGILMCIFILIRYFSDDTIKNAEEMEKYVGAVPLAAIPLENYSSRDKNGSVGKRTEKEAPSLEKFPVPPYGVQEALNRLRINLSYCGAQYKTILITSSVPGEGKSFTAMNLWYALAKTGKKTLMVDVDMRKSTIQSRYHIAPEKGVNHSDLLDYLAGKITAEQTIYPTDIPHGFIAPLYRNIPNPSLLLSNSRLESFLEKMVPEFDYILVDTPPLAGVADALQVASMVDGALVVVQSGKTPRKMIRNSIQQLEAAQCPIIGTVLNQIDEADSYYGKNTYYY